MSCSINNNIPLDIWGEILVRLPAECLIRFRAVSKGWLAVIDDPCFVRTHTNNLSSSSNNNNNIIIIRNSTGSPFNRTIGFYSLYLETLKNFITKEPLLKIPGKPSYHTINPIGAKQLPTTPLDFFTDSPAGLGLSPVAACNGLVLTEKPLRIWNPLTNERLDLPRRKFRFDRTLRAAIGLGYDSTTDDYKVVAINLRIRHGRHTHRTHVYSLKSDSWRRTINCPCPGGSPGPIGPAVFLCGALHWLTITDAFYDKKILALDIAAEKYRWLQMPRTMGRWWCSFDMLLDVLDGCLVLTDKFDISSTHFDVWVLKDYGDDDSWIKLFSINKDHFCLDDPLSPVAFLKEDKTQVFLQQDNCFRFFVFDVVTNILKRVEIHGLMTREDHLYAQQMCPPTILRLHDNCGGGRKTGSGSTSRRKKASPGFHCNNNTT